MGCATRSLSSGHAVFAAGGRSWCKPSTAALRAHLGVESTCGGWLCSCRRVLAALGGPWAHRRPRREVAAVPAAAATGRRLAAPRARRGHVRDFNREGRLRPRVHGAALPRGREPREEGLGGLRGRDEHLHRLRLAASGIRSSRADAERSPVRKQASKNEQTHANKTQSTMNATHHTKNAQATRPASTTRSR